MSLDEIGKGNDVNGSQADLVDGGDGDGRGDGGKSFA